MARERPVHFEAETRGALLTIRLVAEPKCDFTGQFALELKAGSNLSVYKGDVQATAGERIVLSTVSATVDGLWRAQLTVWPLGDASYEQVSQSSPSL